MKYKPGDKVWLMAMDRSITVKAEVATPGYYMPKWPCPYLVEAEPGSVEPLPEYGYLRSAYEWQLSPRGDEDGRQVGDWNNAVWRPKHPFWDSDVVRKIMEEARDVQRKTEA
jgi:hypothetical protein